MLYMGYQTNLRYTFLREKYKNIGGDKKCKRYKCLIIEMTSIEKKEAFLINCCVCVRVCVCVVEEKERNVREQAHKYSSVIKYNRLCINNK